MSSDTKSHASAAEAAVPCTVQVQAVDALFASGDAARLSMVARRAIFSALEYMHQEVDSGIRRTIAHPTPEILNDVWRRTLAIVPHWSAGQWQESVDSWLSQVPGRAPGARVQTLLAMINGALMAYVRREVVNDAGAGYSISRMSEADLPLFVQTVVSCLVSEPAILVDVSGYTDGRFFHLLVTQALVWGLWQTAMHRTTVKAAAAAATAPSARGVAAMGAHDSATHVNSHRAPTASQVSAWKAQHDAAEDATPSSVRSKARKRSKTTRRPPVPSSPVIDPVSPPAVPSQADTAAASQTANTAAASEAAASQTADTAAASEAAASQTAASQTADTTADSQTAASQTAASQTAASQAAASQGTKSVLPGAARSAAPRGAEAAAGSERHSRAGSVLDRPPPRATTPVPEDEMDALWKPAASSVGSRRRLLPLDSISQVTTQRSQVRPSTAPHTSKKMQSAGPVSLTKSTVSKIARAASSGAPRGLQM